MKERLDKILVSSGLAQSRKRAQDMISSEKVMVEGKIIIDYKKEFDNNLKIDLVEKDIPWVSRAALKLLKAIEIFNIEVNNKIALDIGSSTGGFTQVLLEKGAKHVYSIDVGSNQLHSSLINNPKITLREGTHINDVNITDFAENLDIVVIDVSFISLEKVLPKANELLVKGEIIALIKPQFEVGKNNTKKGIVKDEILHKSVCDKIILLGKSLKLKYVGITQSPLLGSDGNTEFLIYFKK